MLSNSLGCVAFFVAAVEFYTYELQRRRKEDRGEGGKSKSPQVYSELMEGRLGSGRRNRSGNDEGGKETTGLYKAS